MDQDDTFNPNSVDLDTADPTEIICYLNSGGNDYDGRLGARISALFVILVISTAATCFPVIATRVKRLRIPLYVYLFARYFGSGVIIATAFIHLLDPAYDEIGPASCVGMTGAWADYSWPPAIVLTSIMAIFLLDFLVDWYVEGKYGRTSNPNVDMEGTMTNSGHGHALNEGETTLAADVDGSKLAAHESQISLSQEEVTRSFQNQIGAFLILEFGVIFHSVIIGLNLGVVGDEFSTLYPVLVFHQSFEGLGIGARLSAIPFPQRLRWMPWLLCLGYGLTTPIAIAIGLGLRTTYDSGSFTANVVSGVLDSISAGILIYTGLVEMLARDFIFGREKSKDKKTIIFMLFSLYLGAFLMALLGKWA